MERRQPGYMLLGLNTWGSGWGWGSGVQDPFPFFVSFLGLHLWHMEVPRLGVTLELQLPAYTTATATRALSCVYELPTPWLTATPDS